MILLLVIKWIR